MEALRAFGYSPEAAIADLVDNSVTAHARRIDIQFHWDGTSSWIAVQDDGSGMDLPTLIEAMRPGTTNPREERSADDLGRFGLGLKTASLSQARSLTVVSKPQATEPSVRRWDLDHIGETREWQLLRSGSPVAEEYSDELERATSGTVVIWEKLDRILQTTGKAGSGSEDRFLEIAEVVESHLAMVFHRLLKGPGKLEMAINGRIISPWDPFLTDNQATQVLVPEEHPAFGSVVGVTPFVLPHYSKLSADEHKQAAGPKGWNAHQGFYVYRNKRLLVPGSWLGLGFRKEEHYKLARIQVDIPNSMDEQWSIDVKKSTARPPGLLRDDLKRIAKLTRERAVQVYRHRGKTVARSPNQRPVLVWNRHVKGDRIHYRINRDYPLVQKLMHSETGRETGRLLRILEETVPVQAIYIDSAERPDSHPGPFETTPESEVESMLYDLLSEYVGNGWDPEVAAQHLIALEPFQDYGTAMGRCVAMLKSGDEA